MTIEGYNTTAVRNTAPMTCEWDAKFMTDPAMT